MSLQDFAKVVNHRSVADQLDCLVPRGASRHHSLEELLRSQVLSLRFLQVACMPCEIHAWEADPDVPD